MKTYDLETPSVLIDLDIMEANIRRMQAHCDALKVAFRPHIKTHKIPEIAQMQLKAGAVGIACQKVTEAEVFADAGFDNIQIPYTVIGAAKTRRLVELAKRVTVTAMVDHPLGVQGFSHAADSVGITLRVLVDLATSLNRSGATPETAIELARKIDADPNLHFAGILVYPSYQGERENTLHVLDALKSAGIAVENVSGGGTGGALDAVDFPELTELRVGTYIFNDWRTVTNGWTTQEHCAMTVAATVVSTPTENRVILDSGSKTLASETVDGLYGHIVEYPDARLYALSEEHGHVDVSACREKPHWGEQVHVIPVHTCVVTNLHNHIYGVCGDDVEVVWPVGARGLVW